MGGRDDLSPPTAPGARRCSTFLWVRFRPATRARRILRLRTLRADDVPGAPVAREPELAPLASMASAPESHALLTGNSRPDRLRRRAVAHNGTTAGCVSAIEPHPARQRSRNTRVLSKVRPTNEADEGGAWRGTALNAASSNEGPCASRSVVADKVRRHRRGRSPVRTQIVKWPLDSGRGRRDRLALVEGVRLDVADDAAPPSVGEVGRRPHETSSSAAGALVGDHATVQL